MLTAIVWILLSVTAAGVFWSAHSKDLAGLYRCGQDDGWPDCD